MGQWLGRSFPYGTLVVNVTGCLAIGVIGTMVAGRLIERPDVVRLVVIVGFLGSLTTFSAFAYETHSLFRDGAWVSAAVNIVVSVVACLSEFALACC